MNNINPHQIVIRPIISYPRKAETGKTYLMTVDVRSEGQKGGWPYVEEEHNLYCILDTGSLFSHESVGEPTIILNRFGGTYGPASFILKAPLHETTGNIQIHFVNDHGLLVHQEELLDIHIKKSRYTLEKHHQIDDKLYRKLWEKQFPGVSGVPYSQPAAYNGRLFIANESGGKYGARQGMIHALVAATGEIEWQYDIPNQRVARILTAVDNHVLVATEDTRTMATDDNAFIALDAMTGAELWRFPVPAHSLSAPAVANGLIFFTTNNRAGYGLDLYSGKLRWRIDDLPTWTPSPPAVGSDAFYFGSRANVITAVDFNGNASPLWYAEETGNWIPYAPAYWDGTLYVTGGNEKLHAIDVRTGKLRWATPVGRGHTSPPIAGDYVYVGAKESTRRTYSMQAINVTDGTVIWRFTAGRYFAAPPLLRDGLLFAPCENGRLYVLDALTGEQKWQYPLGEDVLGKLRGTPIVSGDTIAFVDKRGVVYAFSGKQIRSTNAPSKSAYEEAVRRIKKAKERSANMLDLNNLELTAIPLQISQLTNLRKLDLGNNKLTVLSLEITQLTHLQELNLGNNQLTAISPEIGQLTNLVSFHVDSNKLTAIPPEIGQLTNLKHLGIHSNQLTAVPPEISYLTNLVTLGLNYNKLTAIPPEIGQLTNLTIFDLWGNQITAIPPEIGQLGNLTSFDLHGNRLTVVPPEISQLTNLISLNLSHNQLTAIPPEITQLTNLQTLDLGANQLTTVPEWLVQIPQLKELYIWHNPITQPPPELWEETLTETNPYYPVDLEVVRRYYAQLAKEGEAYLYEAKIIIIGEGGAGKTTLARKLLNPVSSLPVAQESTEGIEILKWQFPVPATHSYLYTANIWDFGGQSIYYATHQFFLSKRAVYILLADTRREHTNFYDWLQMQEAFGGDSPIILLKNKNRQQGNECVIENLPHLRIRFPNLKEIIEFSLADVPDDHRWEELLTHLQTYLLALDHVGQPRPHKWVEVRQTINNSTHDKINRRDFLKLCAVCGIDDEADALQLSKYLHNVGDILHFEEDAVLRELVILNPTWALDAVYRVLDNTQIAAAHGQFSRRQLHALWHEAKYDGHRHELLRLMEKFQLCYALRGTADEFIAPQLLPRTALAYQWPENGDDLQLRYNYPLFMPRGILSRAIVVLHKLIEADLVWRVGVVLHDQYARAELLELRGEGEIRIRVSGSNKRDLLMQIVRTLDELHSNFSAKLKYDKQIPCRCATCAQLDDPHFFKLDILLARLARGKATIDCVNDSYTEMSIPELLGDIIPEAKAGDRWVIVKGDFVKVDDDRK